jgi:SAM-dependent methyltransferase
MPNSKRSDERTSLSNHCRDADQYAAALKGEYRFEAECVRARFNCLLRFLGRIKSRKVLEVGCGAELFIDAAINANIEFEKWVIIEPASDFAQKANALALNDPRLTVIQGYGEDPAVCAKIHEYGLFDIVLLSGVLQDVPDPSRLLSVSLSYAALGAYVLVTVPNAKSFHRLLAVEMGLISTPHSLSARNIQFCQNMVFDSEHLRTLLEEAGLVDLEFEGYLFKPFTHTQMERVLGFLPLGASEGLDRLGRQFPEHAAEIAYMGRKPG